MAALDSADDCFRIRLVCTLLDSLGRFFGKGKRALLMDRFLIFFQRYILTKNYILMDLEFMLLDTFDQVKRKAPKVGSLEEANAACSRIVQMAAEFNANVDLQSPESVAEAMASYEPVASLLQQFSTGDAPREREEALPEAEESEPQPDPLSEPSETATLNKVDADDALEIANFDSEFEQMMQESASDARKGVNIGQQRIEIMIPVSAIRRKLPDIGQTTAPTSMVDEEGKMQFALVLKSGKKINIKKIELDSQSRISKVTKERMIQHEQARADEKLRIKENVMRLQHTKDEEVVEEEEEEEFDEI